MILTSDQVYGFAENSVSMFDEVDNPRCLQDSVPVTAIADLPEILAAQCTAG